MLTSVRRSLMLTLGLMLLMAPRAAAEEASSQTAPSGPMCPICSKANKQDGDYGATSGTTFVRGASNTLLGWTDLFVEPKETMNAGGNFFKGLGVGLADGLANTLGGVVHLITFPLTELDAPLPEGGTQILS